MAIQVQGNAGGIAEVDGSTYRAVRVTLRPTDYGLLGQYRLSMQSGNMAAGLAALSQVFQARWTVTPQLALVWGISVDGMAGGTSSFTAGLGYIGVGIYRSWTVDGSGGTQATLTGPNQTLRSSMAPSLMGSVRIASTGALTAGTSTADAQNFAQSYFAVANTGTIALIAQVGLYGSTSLEDGGNPAPVVLAQNEGIAAVVTVPASGTWAFAMTMVWSEVDTY